MSSTWGADASWIVARPACSLVETALRGLRMEASALGRTRLCAVHAAVVHDRRGGHEHGSSCSEASRGPVGRDDDRVVEPDHVLAASSAAAYPVHARARASNHAGGGAPVVLRITRVGIDGTGRRGALRRCEAEPDPLDPDRQSPTRLPSAQKTAGALARRSPVKCRQRPGWNDRASS